MFTYHPHATYSVDRRGYYTDANPRALAMTGLSMEEMRQTHFAQVIHPEDVPIIESGFEGALAGMPQVADARVLSADGQVVYIRCTMIPVIIGDEVVGVHGVTEDVTEAKGLVRQLQEANAAKILFLANVSHEVRTPLASVIGATELLLEAELEPQSEHFARIVHRNGERLMRLVDEVLDFSRLEAGQVDLRPNLIQVRAVIDGVAEWAVPAAQSCGLKISLVVDDSVPTSVVGDGLRISQVLTNLVENAIKFTERGRVDVRVSSRTVAPETIDGTGTPNTWIDFTVTDTGIGIADDRLEGLFEPFTQADSSVTRGYEGVGLGLAICRDLAELMGGEVRSSSSLGNGSTFTFTAPLEHSSDAGVGV